MCGDDFGGGWDVKFGSFDGRHGEGGKCFEFVGLEVSKSRLKCFDRNRCES